MMKKLFVNSILLIFLLLSVKCSERKTGEDSTVNDKSYNDNDAYKLTIIDSITVDKIGYLTPVEYNKRNQNILFYDIHSQNIIETDSRGKILNDFFAKGEGDKEYGNILSNIGYYNDTCLVLAGTKGYFFYKTDGSYLYHIDLKNPLAHPIFQTGERIREIQTKSSTLLVSWFMPALPMEEMLDFRSKSFYEKMKFLTFYDIKSKTYKINFGYEPESIFRKYDYLYPAGKFSAFDFNYEQNAFYVIHNPDTKIYKYNFSDSPVLTQIIHTNPHHFVLPYKPPFNTTFTTEDQVKAMHINSALLSINSIDDLTILTYHTTLPEEVYNGMKSLSEVPSLWAKYHKCYAVIMEQDNKVAEVELPRQCVDVGFIKSRDYIFMRTNTENVEYSEGSIFYICKLEKR
jgi:hypothetical protein